MFKDYLEAKRSIITAGDPVNKICFDGVVDEKSYFSNDKRLMFLLKETNGNRNNGDKNDKLTDWDYMKWVHSQSIGETGLYRSVYRNIAMWSRMFNIYTDENRKPDITELIDGNGLIINETLCNSLLNIAIINLKKSWGVEVTDWNEMNRYLENEQRKEIIRHQVNTLKPTIVLCGGTFDFAKTVFDVSEEEVNNGIRYFKKDSVLFVNCYHPSKRAWKRTDSFKYIDNIFNSFIKR